MGKGSNRMGRDGELNNSFGGCLIRVKKLLSENLNFYKVIVLVLHLFWRMKNQEIYFCIIIFYGNWAMIFLRDNNALQLILVLKHLSKFLKSYLMKNTKK